MMFSHFSLKSFYERAILCVLGELCLRLHSYNGKTCKNIRMSYITCYCIHELTLQKKTDFFLFVKPIQYHSTDCTRQQYQSHIKKKKKLVLYAQKKQNWCHILFLLI